MHSVLEMETGKVGWTPLTERRNEGPKREILTLLNIYIYIFVELQACTAVQSSESSMNQVVTLLTVPNLTLVDVSTKE